MDCHDARKTEAPCWCLWIAKDWQSRMPARQICRVFCGVKPCGVRLRKNWLLRGLPHPNHSKEPRKDDKGQDFCSWSRIWPPVCQSRCPKRDLRKPFGLTQPDGQITPQCHCPFSSQPPVLWGSLREVCRSVCLRGQTSKNPTPQKTSPGKIRQACGLGQFQKLFCSVDMMNDADCRNAGKGGIYAEDKLAPWIGRS